MRPSWLSNKPARAGAGAGAGRQEEHVQGIKQEDHSARTELKLPRRSQREVFPSEPKRQLDEVGPGARRTLRFCPLV